MFLRCLHSIHNFNYNKKARHSYQTSDHGLNVQTSVDSLYEAEKLLAILWDWSRQAIMMYRLLTGGRGKACYDTCIHNTL